MGNIKLLDCTLRDGGYVNNWNFGKDVIADVLQRMIDTKVDIVEAGFIRDVQYDADKAVYSSLSDLDVMLSDSGIDKGSSAIATMAEIAHPIPLEHIEDAADTNCDIIRVIVWKSRHTPEGEVVDALMDSYEYCKKIAEKGYKLCIQPNRTDQYSDEEFENMLKLFTDINPYAIYVVDSWGTMYSNKVLHYMEIADRVLPKNIAMGFHGHNNMMQAFSNAERIIERNFDRDIIIDASVDGIGRGAGNLNLELIALYLNKECGTDYKLEPMYDVYDRYIKQLAKEYKWGSTFPFILSAVNDANPNYAADFSEDLTLRQMQAAYDIMENDDIVLYTKELSHKYEQKIMDE